MMFLLNVGEYSIPHSSRKLPNLHLSSTSPTKDELYVTSVGDSYLDAAKFRVQQ
jgi:hypothetical protein